MKTRLKLIHFFAATALIAGLVSGVSAQDKAAAPAGPHKEHAHGGEKAPAADVPMQEQLAEMRAKIARLEAALEQGHRGTEAKVDAPPMKMGMDMKKRGMAKGDDAAGEGMAMGMGGMKTGMTMGQDGMKMGMDGMKMGMGGMGMKNAGMMGKMPDDSLSVSALPGFPGASHIYHIGATDFFLDHAEHIGLNVEQSKSLGQLKEKTLLAGSEFDRGIEKAEQELWSLTGADAPDAKAIEAKLRDIEKQRIDQRLGFIRAVGEAARILTEEQRLTLTGAAESSGAAHPN